MPRKTSSGGTDKYGLAGSYNTLHGHEQRKADLLCGGNQAGSGAVSDPPIPGNKPGGDFDNPGPFNPGIQTALDAMAGAPRKALGQ